MAELYNNEHIQRTATKEEKVFHSIDNLVQYLKVEYCPTENKKLIEPFREHDTAGEFIEAQLKQEDQNFLTRMNLTPDKIVTMEESSVVTVKIPFNNYNDKGLQVGIGIEQFFVDRPKCLNSLKD